MTKYFATYRNPHMGNCLELTPRFPDVKNLMYFLGDLEEFEVFVINEDLSVSEHT